VRQQREELQQLLERLDAMVAAEHVDGLTEHESRACGQRGEG
jgi:hypothetical protein